ncbi:TPA: hypothetical protein ACK3JW_000771 [Mannheimia haemolytica]
MKLFNLSALFITSMVLAGCATQQYFPKTLDDKAKGISTVRTTPYGCKVLGEIEGKDNIPPTPPMVLGNTLSSLSSLREGAMNDLRNNAIDVVGNSKKRTVLKIVSEVAFCSAGVDCPNQAMESQHIHSYLVKAEIFECGDK